MKYIGIRKKRIAGRRFFSVSFTHEGKVHAFGHYKDEKSAAKGYDLYVIRNRMHRETNFLKKKLD